MEYTSKNRDWVKNAAIIFLSVLLVLTFFSNTWMNRSLPEVATQSVSSGSITAKVRGTGAVTAVGSHVVKAEQTREIRAVMVKVGQEVKPGDVLFVLGQGEAGELESAQEKLRQLELSYQRTAAGIEYSNYAVYEERIRTAREAEARAEQKYWAIVAMEEGNLPTERLNTAREELETAQAALEEAEKELTLAQETCQIYRDVYNELVAGTEARCDETISGCEAAAAEKQAAASQAAETAAGLEADYQALKTKYDQQQISGVAEGDTEVTAEALNDAYLAWQNALTAQSLAQSEAGDAQAALDQAREAKTNAMSAIDDTELRSHEQRVQEAQAVVDEDTEAVAKAQELYDAIAAAVQEMLDQQLPSPESTAAKTAWDNARLERMEQEESLRSRQASDARAQTIGYIDLTDLNGQIEAAKKKVAELSGGEENQILARVAGTVRTMECTAGDTKAKGDILCTIEVPDMGYTLSFTVTNDQARRLKPGDTASVTNYYWGNNITATLDSIKTDPKNPQTNKLLTFTLEGDVSAGTELTLSVGQKSANYDTVVPRSAIRSDTNGSFVLSVEAKNSPLGNRYVARRVPVTVLAEDDMSAAVTAELSNGSYVITTGSAPIKSGDLVRLADNG